MRLSSRITFVYKVVPILLGIRLLYVLIFVDGIAGIQKRGLVVGFFLAGLFFVGTYRWKQVYLENGLLRISNYLRAIKIDPANIESAGASAWWAWQPSTITIKLKSSSRFGSKIVFVPKSFGGEPTDPMSVISRLRQSALNAK